MNFDIIKKEQEETKMNKGFLTVVVTKAFGIPNLEFEYFWFPTEEAAKEFIRRDTKDFETDEDAHITYDIVNLNEVGN